MGISSIIIDSERVDNTERGFGEVGEKEGYLPANRKKEDGTIVPLLFLDSEVDAAENRAASQPEDVQDEKNWVERIFKG